jgi:hypothetical protein
MGNNDVLLAQILTSSDFFVWGWAKGNLKIKTKND